MLADIFVELVGGALVALLVQVLQDRVVNVLLRCREVVQIYASTSTITPFFQVVPWATIFSSAWCMSRVNALECLGILMPIHTNVSVRLYVSILRATAIHFVFYNNNISSVIDR